MLTQRLAKRAVPATRTVTTSTSTPITTTAATTTTITTRLFSSTPRSLFTPTSSARADFTHVIIGGGVVGLSIARQLSQRPCTSTLLLERHASAGTETSSRNSEVIHAGLYYGLDSLKTRLCLRGKELLYSTCAAHGIRHRQCGKWIVAQDEAQLAELQKVHDFAKQAGVPIRWVGKGEAREREPEVRAEAGVLESTSTGIVDSHGLMAWLEGEVQANGGELAYHTSVTGLERGVPGNSAQGYTIRTRDVSSSSSSSGSGQENDDQHHHITADIVINSAGLNATTINNMLLPPSRHVQPFYAKGTYFSYSTPDRRTWRAPRTLIYPAPTPGHGGLGTHLTLDLSEPPRVRFGPDVEWVTDPTDYTPSPQRLELALDDIQSYLPGLERDKVQVDYCGIRPKLGRLGATASDGGKGFQDFVIREEGKGEAGEAGEAGFEGFVNLLGIESPGLTSSLAIGEEVDRILYG